MRLWTMLGLCTMHGLDLDGIYTDKVNFKAPLYEIEAHAMDH